MASKTKMGQFLKAHGSDQNEAAKALGMTASAFSMRARGFSDKHKEKLAEYYGVDVREIREALS